MIPALLRRAADLVPVLKERAAAAERLRQIPPETVKDLIASGLIRIGNPRRYGGLDADLDTIHEVSWELGRGCGSTAWSYSSGCDAASWAMVATTPADLRWLLLPRGDYEIVDTWFA